MRLPLTAVTLAFVAVLSTGAAHAQATRTWVSGVGDDVNPCSRTAPCKTFAGAISKTAAGGEINAMDSGGFGALTITKSITIDGHGHLTSILASATNGVTVNAGPNDVVRLRGLSINGAGAPLGIKGVRILSAKAVHIEDTQIFNFSQEGIELAVPPATASPTLLLRNVSISRTQTAVKAAGGSVVVDKSQLVDSGTGLAASAGAKVSVHDSVISANAADGVLASDAAEVNLERGLVSLNAVGLRSESGGVVRISEVMVSQNETGLSGNVESFGNNRLAAGNTASGSPSAQLGQQ